MKLFRQDTPDDHTAWDMKNEYRIMKDNWNETVCRFDSTGFTINFQVILKNEYL